MLSSTITFPSISCFIFFLYILPYIKYIHLFIFFVTFLISSSFFVLVNNYEKKSLAICCSKLAPSLPTRLCSCSFAAEILLSLLYSPPSLLLLRLQNKRRGFIHPFDVLLPPCFPSTYSSFPWSHREEADRLLFFLLFRRKEDSRAASRNRLFGCEDTIRFIHQIVLSSKRKEHASVSIGF